MALVGPVVESLGGFKPTHFGGGGVIGEFIRDEDGQVTGHRVVSGHPTVAERADAPLSNSGDSGREGSTPSRGTHVHRPVLGEGFYDRGVRYRRASCGECGEQLEARRA